MISGNHIDHHALIYYISNEEAGAVAGDAAGVVEDQWPARVIEVEPREQDVGVLACLEEAFGAA